MKKLVLVLSTHFFISSGFATTAEEDDNCFKKKRGRPTAVVKNANHGVFISENDTAKKGLIVTPYTKEKNETKLLFKQYAVSHFDNGIKKQNKMRSNKDGNQAVLDKENIQQFINHCHVKGSASSASQQGKVGTATNGIDFFKKVNKTKPKKFELRTENNKTKNIAQFIDYSLAPPASFSAPHQAEGSTTYVFNQQTTIVISPDLSNKTPKKKQRKTPITPNQQNTSSISSSKIGVETQRTPQVQVTYQPLNINLDSCNIPNNNQNAGIVLLAKQFLKAIFPQGFPQGFPNGDFVSASRQRPQEIKVKEENTSTCDSRDSFDYDSRDSFSNLYENLESYRFPLLRKNSFSHFDLSQPTTTTSSFQIPPYDQNKHPVLPGVGEILEDILTNNGYSSFVLPPINTFLQFP